MRGITLLRWLLGLLFVGHGTQKLFGWFGGGGPDATGEAFASMGLHPGKPNAIAAGASEAGGGLLLAAGVATPLAAAALSGTMITAIRRVHAANGPWVTDGGWEFNAMILAAVLAITDEDAGLPWALAQLAAGAAGSFAVTELARRSAPSGDPATA